MKATHVVEAALFSAGEPVAVDYIQDRTGLTKRQVESAIKELKREYESRDTVLEVGKAGTKWAMQVKAKAAEPAAKFAAMEIPKKVLKTLALIAYHQPMKQSELKDMIGSKVYDHVHELKERGLIKTRRDGQTKLLTTTATFPEYFGLDAASPDEIRILMGKLVGVDAPPKRKESKELDAFATAAPPTPAPDEAPAAEAPKTPAAEAPKTPAESDAAAQQAPEADAPSEKPAENGAAVNAADDPKQEPPVQLVP